MVERYSDSHRSWIEIDLSALRYNVKQLCHFLDTQEQFMAVVKANAYGHGMIRICQELNAIGIKQFAVATLGEAIILRKHHIEGEILILGYTDPQNIEEIRHYHLTQTLIDDHYAYLLEQQHVHIQVHLAIDTGMHRLGVESLETLKRIFEYSYLHITGVFSHLCVCDEITPERQDYTYQQIESFLHNIQQLQKAGYDIGKAHLLSSYGLLHYPQYCFDNVRMGILMYGVDSSFPKQTICSLKPVLSLKSKIVLIREIKKNETVGYGRSFQAQHDMKIAVVPIGYGDGLPRLLSNQGHVIVNGQYAPIIGRICMDQMMIDVSDITDIQVEDIVTVIGEDKIRQDVETLAKQTQTISNEILCCLSPRLPRIYKY